MSKRLHIVFSGMMAGTPLQGGASWAILQYLLGFRRLGHDVTFIEPVSPPSDARSLGASASAAYFRQLVTQFGLHQDAALLLPGSRETVGLPYERLIERSRRADLLINVSGMLQDEPVTAGIAVRTYLDLDPAFNQLWQAVEGVDMRLAGHTHYITIGRAIGQPDCPVPTCGVPWIPAFQPVLLECWPEAEHIEHDALTTVGNWRGYGSITHEGVLYGQKAHSLRRFISLPTLTREQFRLALAIHPDERKDLAALREYGWQVCDPAQVAKSPASYQRFVQGSKAEFGIAKSGYAVSRCGWFSDRSVCYLASGRPVIAQETGFSRFLPTGEGLFAFDTCEQVLEGIGALRADYARHARAARALAETYFDSDRVLTDLLRAVGL